jgi:hypothetical protein
LEGAAVFQTFRKQERARCSLCGVCLYTPKEYFQSEKLCTFDGSIASSVHYSLLNPDETEIKSESLGTSSENRIANNFLPCVIPDFRRGVNEICDLLVFTQRRIVVSYGRLGKTYLSHFQGSSDLLLT